MKNRIWKQIKQITVAAAVAGTVLFGSVHPGMAADSELQSGQELSDDREKEDGYEHMEELHPGKQYAKRMKRRRKRVRAHRRERRPEEKM